MKRRPAVAGAGFALLVLGLAGALIGPETGAGQSGALPVAQPLISPADIDLTLMGSSPGAEPSEAWGFRLVPNAVAGAGVDGRGLEFGAPPAGNPNKQQLGYFRYRRSTGWQLAEIPADENGAAYRGFTANQRGARMTPNAGGVLVGRDPDRPADQQLVVTVRNPGGRFTVAPAPPAGVLKPAQPAVPASPGPPAVPAQQAQEAEELAGERGTGRVVLTAFERAGRLNALFAPQGRTTQDGIVLYDGTQSGSAAWSREPICEDDEPDPCVPPASGRFQVIALSATSDDNAWMLVRPAEATPPDPEAGITLYRRVRNAANTGWEWRERPLNAPLFERRASTTEQIADLGTLDSGSEDPLTATTDGVWIDGSLRYGVTATAGSGTRATFSLLYRPGSASGAGASVERTYCTATRADGSALCNDELGFDFSSVTGYRSFAWPGGGHRSRIVTNALDTGGDDLTNRGTYARFDGRWRRLPGGGGDRQRSGAFASVDEGWLEGPTHITLEAERSRLVRWPVATRAPLSAVAPGPGQPVADANSQALAVGQDGGVTRYRPGEGWVREFLLTASGTVSRANLRGVAWPEAGRAHAVGELGAMWLWRAELGEWERDPGAPLGFEGNLNDVAFQPGNPFRGYAVGRQGVLLRYDKSWEQEPLPEGFANADFTSVAFAGNQALVASGGDVLSHNGGSWQVDPGVQAALSRLRKGTPQILAVGGLPDGGAVAAGRDVVLIRDSQDGPWRSADQPLPGVVVTNAAPFREGSAVRALVTVLPRQGYPPPDDLPLPDPNSPPPLIPPFLAPGDGYLLRETSTGWRDEQPSGYSSTSTDRPVKTDPVLDILVSPEGNGWAVGGWNGYGDFAGRGSSGRNVIGRSDRARVQTAGMFRYAADGNAGGPPATAASPVPLGGSPIRFAIGGHAQCEARCADLANQAIAPDRGLETALGKVAGLRGNEGGPRAFLYTGGRLAPSGGTLTRREANRYAEVLGSRPDLPTFGAVAPADSQPSGNGGGTGGTGGGSTTGDATAFKSAFAGFNAPFGGGGLPSGFSPVSATTAGPGARTHYAFDTDGPGGTVRVVVIDNSRGSLEASDPHQNPAEPQKPWLTGVLQDARTRGIPAIVVGSRSLATRFTPTLNVASDGDEVARILLDNGASAYFSERPEETRALRIPSASTDTIPEWGTGTLAYRSALSGNPAEPDQLFGEAGYLLVEIDKTARDQVTNRAPVNARLIPLVDDLSLQAVDGTLLRRSRVALFQGLGRRPLAGDRWGPKGSDDNASPAGSSPYTSFPPEPCLVQGCSTRVTPEFQFTSSDPDIADFVRLDPNTTSLRKPLQDATGRVITDSASGLLCAFNAGTTTVTVRAGGLAYSQRITVLDGSVQQPCGTRPLNPNRFTQPAAPAIRTPDLPSTPQPVPTSPEIPPIEVPLLPPVPAVPPVVVVPPPLPEPRIEPIPPPPPALPVAPVPLAPPSTTFQPTVLPPPAPPPGRPIPPGGALARVFQVEEKREEEVAPEESQAFARYDATEDAPNVVPWLIGAVLLLAIGGTTLRGRGGTSRPRPTPAPARTTHRRPRK